MSATTEPGRRTADIVVGFSCRPSEGARRFVPEHVTSGNAYAQTDAEARTEEFVANARRQPYVGTFAAITLFDASKSVSTTLEYRPPGSGKKPVAQLVRDYLAKYYPEEFGQRPPEVPRVRFIGFDVGTFLDMLGVECSMPPVSSPLPVWLWRSDRYRFDLLDAVLPGRTGVILDAASVVRARKPAEPEASALWDRNLESWAGPGEDATVDAWLAMELTAQLGL